MATSIHRHKRIASCASKHPAFDSLLKAFRPKVITSLTLLLALVSLVSAAWADGPATSAVAPTIRDAYVDTRGVIDRHARLTDKLTVIVCKYEFDAWMQSQHPTPNLSLYLDGVMMKGASATLLDQKLGTAPDAQTLAIQTDCATADPRTATALADQKHTADAASAASDAATKEKDPAKMAQAKALVESTASTAKAAKDKVDAVANTSSASGSTYAINYYLDPQLVDRPDTKDAWIQLLRKPWNNSPVAVSIGPDYGAWPSKVTVAFQRQNLKWLAAWLVGFLAALTLFVKYARTSDIIRDTGCLPAGTPAGTKKAYSLARSQMAVWTFIVAGALAFIFLVTWNENAITPGILVLLGLSFGTSLLAAVSDGSQPVPNPTHGFLADILSDGDGPSFHRYQMVMFTLILVVIFVTKVATNMVMPEFDATLLGLMGISNGTYIGFKLQSR